MNNFPKGNDLIVKWAIQYSDGSAFPFANYAYELCYSAGRGLNVVQDTTVISASDNVLTWRFAGTEQAFKGSYSLTLRLYQGGKLVATVSKRNAFTLDDGRYDGPCDIDLVSYCDNISLQDALLMGAKSIEASREAKDIAGSAVDTANEAVQIADEAKTIAGTANGTSDQAKAIAGNAKDVADQAKTTADSAVVTATQKAEEVARKEAQLEAALDNLSPDQSGALSLSAKVNEHGEKLSELEGKVREITNDGKIDHSNDTFVSTAAAWKVDNGRIASIDSPSNQNSRKIAEPIRLISGDKITISSATYGGNINMFIVTDSNGIVIANRVPTATAVVETMEYVATQDCDVYINKLQNRDFSCFVETPIKGRLDIVEEDVTDIKESLSDIRALIFSEDMIAIDEPLAEGGQFFVDWMLFWTVSGKWAEQGVASPYRPGMGIFHIPSGFKVTITASSRAAFYYMLSDLDGIEVGGTPHLIPEQTSVVSVPSGTTANVPIVEHDYYLAVRNFNNSGVQYYPSSMNIEGTLTEIVNRIDNNSKKIEKLLNNSRYNHGPWGLLPSEFDKGYYRSGQVAVRDDLDLQIELDGSGIPVCVNTYADVLYWMDALIELPNVSNTTITKRAIGTSTDNQTMYEYIFANKRYSVDGLPTKQKPIILIDACIHGFEKNSFFGWYAFLKDMLTNSDNAFLDAISRNIEIHFCPCVNPYGFDHNSYLNANSININRNFDASNWEYVPSGTDASGAEPFDQPESRAIRDWVLSYPKAMMLFTSHTNGRVTNGYAEMNACMSQFSDDDYYNKLAVVFRRHIEMQTQYIPRIYNLNVGSSFCGRYQYSASHGGVETSWARESADMIAMTLEIFNMLRVDGTFIFDAFSNDCIKCCAEICGNILGQFLAEYAE